MFVRHHLHLIELAIWFDQSKPLKQSTNIQTDSTIEQTNEQTFDCFYTKNEVLGLINALFLITNNTLSKQYLNDLSNENLLIMRENLLQIYANSIIQNNKNNFIKKMKKQQKIDRNKYNNSNEMSNRGMRLLSGTFRKLY